MMMRKTENGEVLTGNDRFEGYCKDMMDLIADKLGIRCKTTQLESKKKKSLELLTSAHPPIRLGIFLKPINGFDGFQLICAFCNR